MDQAEFALQVQFFKMDLIAKQIINKVKVKI